VNKSKKISLLTATILALLLSGIIPATASSGSIWIDAASPDKVGYAVDEAVTINAKHKWSGLEENVTVQIQLWNSTDKLEDFDDFTAPVTDVNETIVAASGSETVQYTPTTELTEETGTETYTLKMFSTGLLISEKDLVVVVSESQVTMSVTWQDQNNDRLIEPNEQVTFTVYVNWAFVETTEAHSLYVNYGEGDTLLASISVTAGSGSQTVLDNHGFTTKGERSVVFTLKDSMGASVKTETISINVQTSTPSVTPTPVTPPQATSLVELITSNWQIIAILGAVAVIGYMYLEPDKPKKSGR
jgi:hypothetical protein